MCIYLIHKIYYQMPMLSSSKSHLTKVDQMNLIITWHCARTGDQSKDWTGWLIGLFATSKCTLNAAWCDIFFLCVLVVSLRWL